MYAGFIFCPVCGAKDCSLEGNEIKRLQRLFSPVKLSWFIPAGSVQAALTLPQAARLELGVIYFDVMLFKI